MLFHVGFKYQIRTIKSQKIDTSRLAGNKMGLSLACLFVIVFAI